MIRKFYFTGGLTEHVHLFEKWSDEMKNDKDLKGSLDFNVDL